MLLVHMANPEIGMATLITTGLALTAGTALAGPAADEAGTWRVDPL